MNLDSMFGLEQLEQQQEKDRAEEERAREVELKEFLARELPKGLLDESYSETSSEVSGVTEDHAPRPGAVLSHQLRMEGILARQQPDSQPRFSDERFFHSGQLHVASTPFVAKEAWGHDKPLSPLSVSREGPLPPHSSEELEELMGLRILNEARSSEIRTLQEQLQQLKAGHGRQVQQLQTEYGQQMQQLTDQLMAEREASSQREIKESNVSLLQQQLIESKRRSENLREDNMRMSEELHSAKLHLDNCKSQLETLCRADVLERLRDQHVSLIQQSDNLHTDELVRVREEMESLSGCYQGTIRRMEEEVSQQSREYLREIGRLEQELERSERLVDQLRKEVDESELVRRIQQLESELSASNTREGDIQDENKQFELMLESLRTRCSEAEKQRERMVRKRDALSQEMMDKMVEAETDKKEGLEKCRSACLLLHEESCNRFRENSAQVQLLNEDMHEREVNRLSEEITNLKQQLAAQSQTLNISYEDISESPTNHELAAPSQTLENAIDSTEHSSPPVYSQANAQTLENNISRYQGYQQLIEERNSNSHHYSNSNSRFQTLNSPNSNTGDLTVNSRQFSNANSITKFPSFTEDSYPSRGSYTSKFKYFIPIETNRNIQVGARPQIRMNRKRPRENTIFPCEETEVHMNENPQFPTESVDNSVSENPQFPTESVDNSASENLQFPTECVDNSASEKPQFPTEIVDNSASENPQFPTESVVNSASENLQFPTESVDNSASENLQFPTESVDNSASENPQFPTESVDNSASENLQFPTESVDNSASENPQFPTESVDNSASENPQFPTESVDNSASENLQFPTESVDNSASENPKFPTESVDNSASENPQFPTESVVNSASENLQFPTESVDNSASENLQFPTESVDNSASENPQFPTESVDNSASENPQFPTESVDNSASENPKFPTESVGNSASENPQFPTESVDNSASENLQFPTECVDNSASENPQFPTESVDNSASENPQFPTESVVNSASENLQFPTECVDNSASENPQFPTESVDNSASENPQFPTESVDNSASENLQFPTESVDNSASENPKFPTESVDNSASENPQFPTESVVNSASENLQFPTESVDNSASENLQFPTESVDNSASENPQFPTESVDNSASENPQFPTESVDNSASENPQFPTESVDNSASENSNIDIDESILSTLEDRLQSLAAAPVEEVPIYISSDEPDNEPDLYTQIELMDNKNFDVNIAIADLDNPQPYDLDLPVPDPTIHTLSDSEPVPKVRKPRKVPEKITKRYRSKLDPSFVPEMTESTDVSYGELSDSNPKPKKLQKIKDRADVETEKTDHIEKERRVGRLRKYEEVVVPPKVRIRKRRYHKKKRHAPAHYARLKEQAIREGRYFPKLHDKRKRKRKLNKTKCPSESDDSYQPDFSECSESANDWISKPTMRFWSTGEMPYDTTMQMVSSKDKYFSLKNISKLPIFRR